MSDIAGRVSGRFSGRRDAVTMKGRDRVTAMDVAALAGVSQSAVSRVFTPGASASKATVAKVMKASAELGYRPNILARSLITGRSRIVGVALSYLDNQFYPEALERFSAAFQEAGYHILLFLLPRAGAEADLMLEQLLDYQADGMILASVGLSDELAARCEAAGLPVVLFNRGQEAEGLSQVTSDNRRGGAEIARFLVAGGHCRIAQITGALRSMTGRDRDAGFRDGLRAAGAELWRSECGAYDRERAIAAARLLCDGSERPDAIFVGNDHMAFAVIDTLRHDLGIDIPGEISVIGFDNVGPAAWRGYDLTTWRQPSEQMVGAAVGTLLRQIADPAAPPVKLEVPGELILRGSARRPVTWP